MEIQPELISIDTLSKLIDTPKGTIRDWILRARKEPSVDAIPFHKLPGGSIRFQVDDIRRWYARCKVGTEGSRISA